MSHLAKYLLKFYNFVSHETKKKETSQLKNGEQCKYMFFFF